MLLIRLLAKAPVGLQVNDHIVEPGDVAFRHACQLGFEGIVSKRLGSPYRSGRSRQTLIASVPLPKALLCRTFRQEIHRAQGVFSDGSPPQPFPGEGSPETPPDIPLDCHTRAGFSLAN